MIDSKYLTILREVHHQNSVTAAAEKLNVSQSALSHMVRKFEERHNIKVWIKKGRGLQFTHSGRFLLEMAERVLPQLEYAETVLSEHSRGSVGELRVGMECHPCQQWLMQVAAPFLSQWPDVSFEVRTAFSFDGVKALQDFEIDMLVTPDPVNVEDLRFEPVFDYELVLVVSDHHPLSNQSTVTPQDLINQDLITIPVDTDRLDVFTRFLIPNDCRPKRHITVETVGLILQFVAANRGITVLPDWLVSLEGATLPIKTLKLGDQGLFKSIHLGVRQGDEAISYVSGFIDLARETYT